MRTFGKYLLIAELGRGGMANVFLAVTKSATGIQFNKLVVLKRLREHIASDPDFVTMFLDEGRIAARLNHPNVVQTIEVDAADGELFLAMEYLDGQPLSRILSRAREHMPLAMHLAVLADVLGGLHHAHELADYDGTPLNVVHRDVTPHNVFVTYDGQVKLVDFGIAKAEGRISETRQGIVKGKMQYMSPEQARSLTVDRRTDVFAVGIMLFEACVGARMWQGKQEVDVARALVRETYPQSPRDIDPDVPHELDRICRRALSPDLEERYPTAEDFAADLEEFMRVSAPRLRNREIAAWLGERFQDKREQTKRIVNEQLASLREDVDATPPPSATAVLADAVAVAESTILSEREPNRPVGKKERLLPRRRGRVAVLAALPLVAVGVLVAAAGARTPSRSSDADHVTIRLRATPDEAHFVLDDGPDLANPYTGRPRRDGAAHKITASAPGYESRLQVVVFSRDVSIQFVLARKR